MNIPETSPAFPPVPRSKRLLRWIFSLRALRAGGFAFAALVTLLVLAVTLYNFSAQREWLKVKRDLEKSGVPLSIKDTVPPELPDDQNLAMTPILAPLFKVQAIVNGKEIWADKEGRDALISAGSGALCINDAGASGNMGRKAPQLGDWRVGEPTDLVEWQDYYRETKDFPSPEKPGTAGNDVLFALARDKVAIEELDAAVLARPQARFNLRYAHDNPSHILLPHLAILKRFVQYCQLSSIALLAEDRPTEAVGRFTTGFRLMNAVESESLLISHLVRIAAWHILSQVVWQGLASGSWKAEELAKLQPMIEALDFIEAGRKSMITERSFGNAMMERWVSSPGTITTDLDPNATNPMGPMQDLAGWVLPRGLIRRNQVAYHQCAGVMIELWGRIRKPDGSYQRLTQSEVDAAIQPHISPVTMNNRIVAMLVPGLRGVLAKSQLAQAGRDLALVAIALERHRLEKGAYPDRLEHLTPAFLTKVPGDVFSGAALQYSKRADGTFLLYSVGIDGVDQKGTRPASKNEVTASAKGSDETSGSDDVVWEYSKLEE
ncbi:MAG: hypothetical protein FJ405_01405 [Verrucomicrobia bacterium]|nr:hypothetical protein [Verrucomicrobiota bacterium]